MTNNSPVIVSAANTCHAFVDSIAPNVTVTWTWGGVGSPTYYVERSIYPSSGFSVYATTSGLSYEVGGLISGKTYYYRVRAFLSGAFSAYSNIFTKVTPFCPTTLSIDDDGCATAILEWVWESGISFWNVERSSCTKTVFRKTGLCGTGITGRRGFR